MRKIWPYAKAVVAALIPILQLIQAAYTDDVVTSNEWGKIAIAAVLALGVLVVPNKGYKYQPIDN